MNELWSAHACIRFVLSILHVALSVLHVGVSVSRVACVQVREEMNELWRKVFQQNYHKSLDHRSFYFKQSDKKSLMPKAMLQEVGREARAHPGFDCWV